MQYTRMPIEKESPEEIGYNNIECNLAESSVPDFIFNELQLSLDHLKLEYIAHRGKPELRALIATEAGLLPEHVLLTNGAAGALFIINTTLLDKEDHMIVMHPNYATNSEVPKVIGCEISYASLRLEDEWKLNVDFIKSLIQPNTKIISVTSPNNPTGMTMDEKEIEELAFLAQRHNIILLVDETYRDTLFKTRYPVAASKGDNVITVSSLSKAYGLPGLRIGWLITQNKTLMEIFLAAKEMIYISNSALDEEVAFRFYTQKEKHAATINKKAMENFFVLKKWLSDERRLEYVLPQGGVVCFPRIKGEFIYNMEEFYYRLMHDYKTMVGPGHWFNMPDVYMRIGFGWPDKEVLYNGLKNISKVLDGPNV